MLTRIYREELDKAHNTILANSRTTNNDPRAPSQSPVARVGQNALPHTQPPNGSSKPPPTGPRAHKKPRLSETPNLPASAQLKGNRSQAMRRFLSYVFVADRTPVWYVYHKYSTNTADFRHQVLSV